MAALWPTGTSSLLSGFIILDWVNEMSAAGGGDPPDAVADGLFDALNLNYRERATKICVWIGKFC